MTGLDCNILVQLAFADHPAHAPTAALVQSEVERGSTLVVSSLTATEFLHVVTDARRFAPPLTMSDALGWLEEILANPSFRLLDSNSDCLRQTLAWMRQHGLGRKRILDTHLAAMLHTAGIRRLLTSNPADFSVFGVLETVVP